MSVEKDAKNIRRVGYLQKAILVTIGVTGVLAVGLVAPNALKLFGGTLGKKLRYIERSRAATTRLVQKGYVEFVTHNGKKVLCITEEGKKFLDELEVVNAFQEGSIKPKKWDRRWRLVVFDIPEHRRAVRNRLREMIVAFGFIRIQNSVWVYPYDCEELVTLLKSDLRMGREVLYAVVEKIENDKWLLKHFNLS